MTTYSRDYFEAYVAPEETWERARARRVTFYRAMIRLIQKAKPSASHFVEVGCGLGMFTVTMAEMAPNLNIVAGDISDHAVEVAAAKVKPFRNVSVLKLDAEAIAIRAGDADIITAFDVLEHLP